MAVVRVDKEFCKGCFLCLRVCPKKILAAGEGVNKRGTRFVVPKKSDACSGCGQCFLICPETCIEIHRTQGRRR